MARYEETNTANSLPTGSSLVLGLVPWLVAAHFQGVESKMSKVVAKAGVEARDIRVRSSRVALKIARKNGLYKTAAWGAAKRAGLTGSLAKIAASRMAGLLFTAWNVVTFAPLIYSGAMGSVNILRGIGRDASRLNFGGGYLDSRGAYTERQRSLRAITSSRMSTRAAIGNEAMLIHR